MQERFLNAGNRPRPSVEEAAVALATAAPEDSDVNVIFSGLYVYGDLDSRDESVEVAV